MLGDNLMAYTQTDRQRGFVSKRIETPPLMILMRVRQRAVLGKFMNFMQRKNTVVIELYKKAFYDKRPTWESLANFVYSDLCSSAELMSGVVDVQLHHVKISQQRILETRWRQGYML